MTIEIKNLSKSYSKGFSSLQVLEDINLSVDDGELVCILGPSGCGKTTLIRIGAGLESYDSGEVYDHKGLITGPSKERGFIFQQYSLFPWLTVFENVMFGFKLEGEPTEENIKTAEKFLDMVGLIEFKDSYPHELSGGMKQRVAIIRSLINENEVLLMDEPFSALDVFNRHHLQEQLIDMQEKTKKIILFVTHEVEESVFLADKIVIMDHNPGRIKEIIDVNMPHPRNRNSAEFIELENRIESLLGILED